MLLQHCQLNVCLESKAPAPRILNISRVATSSKFQYCKNTVLYCTRRKKTVNLLYEALKNCKVLYKTKGKQENSLTYSINHQFTLNKPFCSYSFVLHLT